MLVIYASAVRLVTQASLDKYDTTRDTDKDASRQVPRPTVDLFIHGRNWTLGYEASTFNEDYTTKVHPWYPRVI